LCCLAEVTVPPAAAPISAKRSRRVIGGLCSSNMSHIPRILKWYRVVPIPPGKRDQLVTLQLDRRREWAIREEMPNATRPGRGKVRRSFGENASNRPDRSEQNTYAVDGTRREVCLIMRVAARRSIRVTGPRTNTCGTMARTLVTNNP
jgi:hypothetical protein